MVLEDGRMEIGIRLRPPSRMLMGDEDLAARHYHLKSVLQIGVPERERARIYIRISPVPIDKFRALIQQGDAANPIARFLVNKRLERLDALRRKGTLKEWSFYVTCTVKASRSFHKDDPPTPEHLKHALKRAHARRTELMNRLNNAGYEAEPMTAQEIFTEVYYYHNLDFLGGIAPSFLPESPERYVHAPEIEGERSFLTLKSQVMHTPTRTEDHHAVVNGSTLVYAVSLHDLPRVTEFGVLNQVAEQITDGNMMFVIEFYHSDNQTEKEKLETARRTLFSATTSKKLSPSASAQERLRTVSESLELMYREGDHILESGVTVLLFAKNRDQLDEMLSQASLALGKFNASRPVLHGFQSKHVYEALAPFNGKRTEFPFKTLETNAIGFMPAIAPFQGVGGGTMIYRNRSNALTVFDPFNAGLSAAHFLLIAKTGWGKTFMAQSIALSLINRYDPVMTVIDRKDDFRDFMLAMGGYQITFGGGGEECINPMDLMPDQSEPDDGKMSFLMMLWRDFIPRGQDEDKAGEEDALLIEAVKITYKAFEQEPLPPLISDVASILQTMSFFSDGEALQERQRSMAQSLATRMRPYLGDTVWGRIIDHHTNVKTDSKYMYYCLERIEATDERQRKIAMRIIMDRVWQQARELPRTVWKLLYVEELASQMKTPSDREYLGSALRLGRSYGISVGGMTQLAADLEFMPELRDSFSFFFFGKLTNTDGLIKYLNMPKPVAEHVRGLQKVNKQYAEWVLAYRPDEGDVNGEVIRAEESDDFYWLCSSRQSDQQLRKAAIGVRQGDTMAAIEDLVAGIYPTLALPLEPEAELGEEQEQVPA